MYMPRLSYAKTAQDFLTRSTGRFCLKAIAICNQRTFQALPANPHKPGSPSYLL